MPAIDDIVVQAQQHVAMGERLVEEQRKRIQALRYSGHSTEQAESLLATFETVLANMREHLAQELHRTEKPLDLESD